MADPKPLYKSMTLVWGAVLAVLLYLEQQGIVASGASDQANALVTGVLADLLDFAKYPAALASLWGARRAMTSGVPLRALFFYLVLPLSLLALPISSSAQTPCLGGTATTPACSRDWSAGPLNVLACPADPLTGAVAGETLVLREISGSPLLSVTAATPGGQVTLPAASAPRAPAGQTVRTIEFVCTAAGFATGGASTFGRITFPQIPAARPTAPTLL